MSLTGGIKAFFEGWEKIDNKDIPEWVNKAYNKWEGKLPTHPYNITKHFVGKTFIYRSRHFIGDRQGEYSIKWYKRLRKKKL